MKDENKSIKHGGQLKHPEKLRNGWKPRTILGKRICISPEEENFALYFSRKMREKGDIYADNVMIELAILQILQIHRQAVYAAEKKIGKDMSRMIGTLLSTLREMNATKNSRKEQKINVHMDSDIMTLLAKENLTEDNNKSTDLNDKKQ